MEEDVKEVNCIGSLAQEHVNRAFFAGSLETCLVDSVIETLESMLDEECAKLSRLLDVMPFFFVGQLVSKF